MAPHETSPSATETTRDADGQKLPNGSAGHGTTPTPDLQPPDRPFAVDKSFLNLESDGTPSLPPSQTQTPQNRNRALNNSSANLHSEVAEDARSLASISLPPEREELKPTAPTFSPFSAEVVILLIPGSIFGVLARLGIHALVSYDGAGIFPLAWVQSAGCFVMGIALALKQPIGNFYGPLYTAIATGFCGSLTTFSSWQIDIFQAWANSSHYHRGWLHDAIDGLTRALFTLAVSLSSLAFGIHIGESLKPHLPTLKPPNAVVRSLACALAVAMYALSIPFYLRLDSSWRYKATSAILFSFPGTFTRYWLSWLLNPRMKLFPLGTFAANTIATALLSAFHVIQATSSGNHPTSCVILQGLVDGYCGCLSTVSTFAVEVRELRGRRAWIYVLVSVVAGQLLCLVILGPSWWPAHLSETPTCPNFFLT